MAKKKKRTVKKGGLNLYDREILRQMRYFVWWRRHHTHDPSDVVTQREIMTFNPRKINPTMVEYVLNRVPVHYHCLTVSYCKDPYEYTYKLYGYAKSDEEIETLKEDISPLIHAACSHAESEANVKQIVGRAMVMAPDFPTGLSLGDAVVKLRHQLDLDERDLAALHDCIHLGQATLYDVSRAERTSPTLDDQISDYLSRL